MIALGWLGKVVRGGVVSLFIFSMALGNVGALRIFVW